MEDIVLDMDVPFLPLRLLKARDLICYYEAGNLRYITCRGVELVRMIYTAVRDDNWNTIPLSIEEEVINESSAGFDISYQATYRSGNIDYRASIRIEGTSDTIHFTMSGEAMSAFWRNRIGICVHHPLPTSMGRDVKIISPGGNSVSAVFPVLVSPHQPLLQIRRMEWHPASGINTTLSFDGDVFETEDQRNWTDASYKTYSTPLTIPIPAFVNQGDTLKQVVAMQAHVNTFVPPSNVMRSEERLPFPSIGYCRADCESAMSSDMISVLRDLRLDHYRADCHLYRQEWKRLLDIAVKEGHDIGTMLELVCHVDENYQPQLEAFIQVLPRFQGIIRSVLILQAGKDTTPTNILDDFYGKIKTVAASISVGYGTNGFFADLNRNRPETENYDFMSFTLHPQVHAIDSRTIVENLQSHRFNISTLRSFTGNKRIHISPVSFNKREGDATGNFKLLPDSRDTSVFAAWWLLMCTQTLAGADQITFQLPDNILSFNQLLKQLRDFQPESIIRSVAFEEVDTNTIVFENRAGERWHWRMNGYSLK